MPPNLHVVSAATLDPALDTFPKLLLDHAKRRDHKPAIREKDFGIWQVWTWREMAAEIRTLACGLTAMGFNRGDKLAIVGENRPQLYWSIAAAQCLGGIPVPVYQDAVAEEMAYVLDNADIDFAVVEDQEQVDKILEIKDRCPLLQTVIYDDPRGLCHYSQPFLHSLKELQQRGREFDQAHPDFFEEEIAKGSGDDISVMLYTSGTTGNPKGGDAHL